MFDHVTIRVAEREPSERFYSSVLGTLGIVQTHRDEGLAEWDDFSLAAADDDHPPTGRLHLGFAAASPELVDEFWAVGTEAGYHDDGAPGPRPQYRDDYYGAFLLDPDGNSAEAVHHAQTPARNGIDHLWLRVVDVASARRFYETIAEHAGFEVRARGPAHVQCLGRGGSFSLVAGEPASENVHMAFPASDVAVDGFHRAAVAAGYRDHGAPGERPQYHPGYYGAYVLDPDGNNIEVVCHHRRA